MPESSVKITIHIELGGDTGIPIAMLNDFFMAHQETLSVIIQSQYNVNPRDKKATNPELRMFDVHHGSMDFMFFVNNLQTVLSFTPGFLKQIGSEIRDNLTGMYTFEDTVTTTTTHKRRYPKNVIDKLSAPFVAGLVKGVTVEVKPSVETVEINQLETTERGELMEFQGELREIDWEKKSCRFFAELHGSERNFRCTILDEVFLTQLVRGNLPMKILAVPIYKGSSLGERTITLLEAQEITILGE